MKNHLATFFADVELEAVAFALVAFGELFADVDEMRHQVFVFFLEIFDAWDGLARDY